MVGLLWVAFCLNFADRQVVFSIFPILRSDLHFSEVQLGLTGSLFLWVYAFCSPFAGSIADRLPKRVLILGSLVLWSAITLFTGFAQSPGPLLAGRATIGLTEALFYPAAVALIAEIHDGRTRSRALALFNSGSVVGIVLGGSLGGYAAEYYSWRWAFGALGLAGILYALPLGSFLRRIPEGSTSAGNVDRPRKFSGARELLRKPTFLVLCAIYSVAAFAAYLLYTWLATFLTEKFHLGLSEAGITATLYAKTAAAVGLAAGGWIADWWFARNQSARFWVLAVSVILTGPALYAVAYAPSLWQIKLAAIAFGLCNGAYQANLFASAFEIVEASRRALAVGVLNLIGASVSGFAGLGGGIWRESQGLDLLMVWSGLSCVLVGLLLIMAIYLWIPFDRTEMREK